MAHIHRHHDNNGDLVDLTYFCGDYCHRVWCEDTDTKYDGWDGCHEVDTPTVCAHCGDPIGGIRDEEVFETN